jgi:hypothetical protein
LNACEIVDKEFDIFCSPSQLQTMQQKQQQTQMQTGFYLFAGHQEKKSELNHFFHYDLGQIILSKGNKKY